MLAFKLVDRGIGVVSILILARLLVPADFGLVAIATAIVGIIALLAQFSFDTALIQDQRAGRDSYDTAWTISLAFGLAIALILLALARPIASFYEEPRLEAVMYFLALGSAFEGCQNIGVVAFRKDLQFHKEFIFLASRRMVGFAVTVPLAFLWRDHWALIAGILASKGATLIMSFAMHPYRPRLSLAAWQKLFHFSKWLMINNILFTIRDRLADFIIAKTAGAGSLGVYTMAYDISSLPTSEVIAPINRALYPAYSKLNEDLPRLTAAVTRVFSVLILAILPAGVGVAAVADPLVRVALGDKWLDAIPLVEIFAFYGIISAVGSNFFYVFLALGRPRRITLLAFANIVVLAPSLLFLSIEYGPLGAAWAMLLTASCVLPLSVGLAVVDAKLELGRFFAGFWRPALSAAGMFFLVRAFLDWHQAGPEPFSQILNLAAAIALGMISYLSLLALLWLLAGRPRAAEHELIEIALNAIGWRRLRGKAAE